MNTLESVFLAIGIIVAIAMVSLMLADVAAAYLRFRRCRRQRDR